MMQVAELVVPDEPPKILPSLAFIIAENLKNPDSFRGISALEEDRGKPFAVRFVNIIIASWICKNLQVVEFRTEDTKGEKKYKKFTGK